MFGAAQLLNLAGYTGGSEGNGVFLRTDRLMLTPYTANIVTQTHIDWLNDKENLKYSEQRHLDHTLKSQREYLNKFPKDSFIWLIQVKVDNRLEDIGSISAYVDPYNGTADMGILIAKEHKGKGYGEESWKRVMDFLVEGNIRKITCGCRSDNAAMICLASFYMTREGRRWAHFLDDNDCPVDLIYFAYHNGSWKASIPGGQYD